MPIRLITGTPGAGKTLLAIEEILKAAGVPPKGKSVDEIRASLQDPENIARPIYVCNVRGLSPGTFETIETPWDWEQCPDGSLILVDEAWEFFGKHLRNSEDPRILQLAKHRHRGFDFIWTTQAPSQLAPFVRDLIGEHIHVTRKFGTQYTVKFTWPHVQDSPNGSTAKSQAVDEAWAYPKEVFSLYESATLHTVKRKFPKKMLLAFAAVPLIIGAIGVAAYSVYAFADSAQSTPGGAPPDAEARSAASTEARTGNAPLTLAEYVALRTPRIAADPSSAPMYDAFEVRDYPRMLCVIGGDQRRERITCNCYTQQVTPINVDDPTCISIARYGYWDPRREPFESNDRSHRSDESSHLDETEQEPYADRRAVGVGGSLDRSILTPYTPPDYAGAGLPSGIPRP